MIKLEIIFFGGGYVFDERNQLQKDSSILFDLSGRGGSAEGVVLDSKESQLAKPCRAEAGVPVGGFGG